ncbi:MAG: hypothetical protein ABIO57_02030 [Candidatus Paceibacterota bacterium]
MENLLKEYEEYSSYCESLIIKPFSSLVEVYELLHQNDFMYRVSYDDKFLIFVRKKLLRVPDKDHNYIDFKVFIAGQGNARLKVIAEQVLLTYFAEHLTWSELERISKGDDVYNVMAAYLINLKCSSEQTVA